MTTKINWAVVDEHTGFRISGPWHSIGRANAERGALAVAHADEMRDADARLDDYVIVQWDDTTIGVHVEHCCKLHGCKYNAETCPVAHGFEIQRWPCPTCSAQEDARNAALDVLTEKMNEHMADLFVRKGLAPLLDKGGYFPRRDFEREVDILLDAGLLYLDYNGY